MLPRLSLLPSLLPARLLLPLLLLAGDADPRPKSDLEAALGGLSPLSSTASALGSDLVAEGGASYRFSLLWRTPGEAASSPRLPLPRLLVLPAPLPALPPRLPRCLLPPLPPPPPPRLSKLPRDLFLVLSDMVLPFCCPPLCSSLPVSSLSSIGSVLVSGSSVIGSSWKTSSLTSS